MLPPLSTVLQGEFFEHEDSLYLVADIGPPVSINQALAPFLGASVTFLAHHAPPQPTQPYAAGFGTCLWRGQCPLGHIQDPQWLYRVSCEGVFGRLGGDWVVGQTPLRLLQTLPGHLGRIVLLKAPEIDPQAPTSDLVSDAEALIQTLSGLKGALLDEKG